MTFPDRVLPVAILPSSVIYVCFLDKLCTQLHVQEATDVFLRSTGIHGFAARCDSTFIQGIPGFTSVARIVLNLYVIL